jgi:hypothetical protein
MKDILVEHCLTKSGNVNGRLSKKWFLDKGMDDVYDFIINGTLFCPDETTISRRVYFILKDITEWPLCEYCKSSVKWHNSTTSFSKYCSSSCSANSEVTKDKLKKTNIRRRNVKNPFQCPDVKNKIKDTNLKRYGVDNPSKSEIVKLKINKSLVLQKDTIRQKIQKTCLDKFGYKSPFESPDILIKSKKTMTKRYGAPHAFQVTSFYDKFKLTMTKRYGAPHALQVPDIMEKKKSTCLDRYGAEYPTQNFDIHRKQLSSSFLKKPYTLPSGQIITLQGYEPLALDILLSHYDETDIEIYPEPVHYFFDKSRLYYPDFYIKSTNTIIEVKSQFTYDLEKYKTNAKLQACIQQGYNIFLMIL